MKRRYTEAARWHARDQLLGQFDWRTLADSEAERDRASLPPRPGRQELSAVQREILRLHRQGLQQRDLATLFAMSDSDVEALLFGEAGTA